MTTSSNAFSAAMWIGKSIVPLASSDGLFTSAPASTARRMSAASFCSMANTSAACGERFSKCFSTLSLESSIGTATVEERSLESIATVLMMGNGSGSGRGAAITGGVSSELLGM